MKKLLILLILPIIFSCTCNKTESNYSETDTITTDTIVTDTID